MSYWWLIPLLIVATALAGAYALYRATPAARWRRRVIAHLRALQARRATLAAESGRADAEIARIREEHFRRHLKTIPTDRLADHPGIGPVTVEKVKDASGPFIADVLGLKFHEIPDVGQVRAAALMKALVAVQKDARARFDAGGCPEAQEFRRLAEAVRIADAAWGDERSRELAALDQALKAVEELARFAWDVSFPSFLLRQNQSVVLAKVITRPIPVVVVPPPPPAVPVAPAAHPVPPPVPVAPQAPLAAEPARPVPPADLFRAALAGTPAAPAPPRAVEPDGLARLRAVAGFGLMVAKADGRIAAAERKAVRAFLDRMFGHDPALARSIDPVLELSEKAGPTEGDAVHAARGAFPPAEWPALVTFARLVAAASGEPNTKEREALARIATALGVNPVQSPAVATAGLSPPPAPPPGHRVVLEIPPDAPLDPDLIRRRYANLPDKLDPAKAAAFGPEFARMAEQKRAAVRAAAEALIAPFGEPLEKPSPPPPTDIRENALLDDVFG
jgi:uncharacterized tellurite resistance protein B-like protein